MTTKDKVEEKEERTERIGGARAMGRTNKQLLEFLYEGMKGKSIVYATTKGNFLSPKAVENALTQQKEMTRADTINEIRKEVESKKTDSANLFGEAILVEDIKTILNNLDK